MTLELGTYHLYNKKNELAITMTIHEFVDDKAIIETTIHSITNEAGKHSMDIVTLTQVFKQVPRIEKIA